MYAFAVVQLRRELAVLMSCVHVCAVHRFEQIYELFVDDSDSYTLLLKCERLEPFLDHLNLRILTLRLNSHLHLVSVRRPVLLVE